MVRLLPDIVAVKVGAVVLLDAAMVISPFNEAEAPALATVRLEKVAVNAAEEGAVPKVPDKDVIAIPRPPLVVSPVTVSTHELKYIDTLSPAAIVLPATE